MVRGRVRVRLRVRSSARAEDGAQVGRLHGVGVERERT